jgi:hypothetical protein
VSNWIKLLSSFGFILRSFDLHFVPTSYVTMLEKNEISIDSAPLDAFDNEYGDDDM